MLKVSVPKSEMWSDTLGRFITIDKDYELNLEHSLIAISKWESKWHKPFLSDEAKSYEETCDYIRCMNTTHGVPDEVFKLLPDSVIAEANEYIGDPATATWFNEAKKDGLPGRNKKEVITSEIVYYWMIELNIPEAYAKWHFNRLMTLIKVINIKHEEADPNRKNKMSRNEILAQNAKLNAARRAAMHSKG